MLIAASALAQQSQPVQAPPQNPLDIVPDKLAFNVPYGAPIALDKADAVISAAASEAKKRDWPLNIAVVDSAGHLVAFKRMDGAILAGIPIAEKKARAAVAYRRPTKAFQDAVHLPVINVFLTLDGVVASAGGIPLIEDGKIIGAIGCSGGSGSQDDVVAKVGAAVINK